MLGGMLDGMLDNMLNLLDDIYTCRTMHIVSTHEASPTTNDASHMPVATACAEIKFAPCLIELIGPRYFFLQHRKALWACLG